jgi:hypothetical protein
VLAEQIGIFTRLEWLARVRRRIAVGDDRSE